MVYRPQCQHDYAILIAHRKHSYVSIHNLLELCGMVFNGMAFDNTKINLTERRGRIDSNAGEQALGSFVGQQVRKFTGRTLERG